MKVECRGFAWLPTGLAITLKEIDKMLMFRGHKHWNMIEGELTVKYRHDVAGAVFASLKNHHYFTVTELVVSLKNHQ